MDAPPRRHQHTCAKTRIDASEICFETAMGINLAASLHHPSVVAMCPVCDATIVNLGPCRTCGFVVAEIDGVLDLRVDKSFDTLLDTSNYAEQHSASRACSGTLANGYLKLIDNLGVPTTSIGLEIACGPGTLTGSLLVTGRLSTLHTGDISPAFMTQLAHTVKDIKTPTILRRYLFDANRLPFKDQSFDLVIGNSVLHHFAHFENTIRDASRVLREGGAAAFGEPILDTHVFSSLAAGLIVRAADRGMPNELTPAHLRALRFVQMRAMTKINNLYGEREHLSGVEDKFIFPIDYLCRMPAGRLPRRSRTIPRTGPLPGRHVHSETGIHRSCGRSAWQRRLPAFPFRKAG